VASYLPTYSGSLENSSSVINLWSNAATQATSIVTLTANAATQAGQIAVIDANLGTATTNITTLFANAATQATSINTINANLGTATTNITTLFANAATQAGLIQTLDANLGTATTNITTLFSNAATQATSINTINANLGTATTNITTLFSNAATQSIAITSLATNANANTAAYLPGYTGNLNSINNLTVTGSLTSDDITSLSVYVQGNAIITGNLTVLGNTTTINSNVITTNDKNITVANNISTAVLLDGAGLDAGQNAYATWRYNYLSDSWQSNIHITPATDNTENLGAVNNRWNTVYATTLVGTTIDTINANLGTATTNITTLFSNAATQATSINTINANIGAYETWANAAISASYFSGNLAGNTLIDSVRGRVFANAYPESVGNIYVGGTNNTLNYILSNTPAYSGGIIQPGPNNGQSNQVMGFVFNANFGLQSGYSSANQRTTQSSMFYAQVTPVTANVMLNQDRVRGHTHVVELNNAGTLWGTMGTGSVGSTNMVASSNFLNLLGYGNVNHGTGAFNLVQNIPWNGSSNVQYATATFSSVSQVLTPGSAALPSNIAYARWLGGTMAASANLTITNAIGIHTQASWAGANGITNRYVVLNEDSSTAIQTNGNLTATGANVSFTGFLTTTGNSVIGATGATQLINGNVVFQSAAPYNTQMLGNVIMGAAGTSYNTIRGTTQIQGATSMTSTLTVIGATTLSTATAGGLQAQSIGNVTPGSGAFTTLSASSTLGVSGTTTLSGNVSFAAPYYETISNSGAVSGSVTVDTGIGNSFTLLLTGDITLNTINFTNMIAGKSITLTLIQDATGGRILSSDMKFAGGINTLSSAAGAIDVLNIYYDGTRYLASLVKGYV
jgi:hypothetical protein